MCDLGKGITRKRETGESQKLIRWYRNVDNVARSHFGHLTSDSEKADFSLRSK